MIVDLGRQRRLHLCEFGLSLFIRIYPGKDRILKLDAATQDLLHKFFGYSSRRSALVEKQKKQLAHYTTADTAMKIVKGRSIWLRNAAVMNDHSEIQYGKHVMDPILRHGLGNRFRAILNAAHPGVAEEVMRQHEDHKTHARETVFMTSLCEHPLGDRLGRLSMWRAYGGPVAGVALLFSGSIVTLESSAELQLVASPVYYGDINSFHDEFESLVEVLESSLTLLKQADRPLLIAAATAALQFAMLSIKHPGFAEEEEWRLIYRPYQSSSSHIIASTISIGGIPQTIHELPFHNPEKGPLFDISDMHLNEILEGVIIGPCLYPETVYRAFIDELEAAGVENVRNKVFASDIPLRQWG